MPQYPMLRLLVRFGKPAVAAICIVFAAGMLMLGYQGEATIASVSFALFGVVIGGALGLCFVEMAQIIVDLLVPHS